MKNLHINPLFYFLLIGLASGCKKELNVYPTSSEVDGNVITDVKSAGTALNGVYYQFAAAGLDNNGVPSIKWTDIMEVIPSQLSGMLVNSSGGSLYDHTYTPDGYDVAYVWNYGYAIVNAANGFLKNIAPASFLTASVKQEMTGEAKFLRAYANSILLLYYGQYYDINSEYGIIVRSEFVTPDNIALGRSTVKASYDSIVADLDYAIANLPGTNKQMAYATSWAAKLLKARLLINRGTGTDYATVISLTDDIISNGPFALEGNVKDLFLTKGLASPELILGVQPYPTQVYKYSDYQYYAQWVPSDTMVSLFAVDPRAAWTFNTVSAAYGDETELTKYYPGSFTDINPVPITENSYAMRLTEAYLLEAEALTLSGGDLPQARTLLETVLSHAGIMDFSAVEAETTAAGMQELVVKEEMKNFVSEAGQDWFAVRRLPFATMQSLIPSIGSPELFSLPIPKAEITANGKIKQNPGY